MANKKILAIDDDDMVLLYLRKLLEDNYTLVTCAEPEFAVALALTETPDLILCDIDMPEMDGGAVCAALAENPKTAGIPFIYLTSMVSPREARELDGFVGGRPGVSKRATLPVLMAAIENLIHRPA